MKIGIDLLWVRPGIVGGTESYIRNLLHGFGQYGLENEYILFVATDNADTFAEYEKYQCMKLCVCPTVCASQIKRLLWENLHLDKTAKKQGVDVMFIPVYSKPGTYGSKIPYVCVIHDLQALHYPEYFSKFRCLFMKYMWRYTCKTADKVVTSSDFCKNDLIQHYPMVKDKIQTIYIPVISNKSNLESSHVETYGVKPNQYFYCVSSMLPHKNLNTLLRAMQLRKEQGKNTPLVISGVGGQKEAFRQKVTALGLEDVVIDTGFVSDAERDCLYENCRLFLFPSVFEGFGMPPIEAMNHGKVVITTRKSCLEEVTKGSAVYVEEPYDEEEWAEKIQHAWEPERNREVFADYSLIKITKEYMELFSACIVI